MIASSDIRDHPCILCVSSYSTFHPSKSWLNSLNFVLQSVWREFSQLIYSYPRYNYDRGSERPRPSVHFVCLILLNISSQQIMAELLKLCPTERLARICTANYSGPRYNHRRASARPRPSVRFMLLIMLNISSQQIIVVALRSTAVEYAML
jgi:hypothetical protein